MYFMPVLIFVLTIGFAAALSLYWFVGGLIAYVQQSRLLKSDEYDMQQATAVVVSKKSLQKPGSGSGSTATVVTSKSKPKSKSKSKKKSTKKKTRKSSNKKR